MNPLVGLLLSLKLLQASDDAYESASTSPYCTAPTAARHLPLYTDLHAAIDVCGQSAQVAFIHVGKTGGSTLSDLLKMAIPGSYTEFHEVSTLASRARKDLLSFQDTLQCAFTHYIVSTRDPLNRTVSAFNYGDRSGLPGAVATPASERLYGSCFPARPEGGAVSAFAEALGADSECGALARACLFEPALDCAQHVPRGHAYIFRDTGLLDVLRQDAGNRRVWLVRQESFDEDVAGLWKWLCLAEDKWVDAGAMQAKKTSYPRKNDTWLSDEGARQLRAALSMESYVYNVLEGLADNARSSAAADLRGFSQTGEAGACAGACVLSPLPLPPPEVSAGTQRLNGLLLGLGGLLVGIVAGRCSSGVSLRGRARRHRRLFDGDAAAVPATSGAL